MAEESFSSVRWIGRELRLPLSAVFRVNVIATIRIVIDIGMSIIVVLTRLHRCFIHGIITSRERDIDAIAAATLATAVLLSSKRW